MSAEALTLHFPAAIECEVTDKAVPIDSSLPLTLTNVSGLREFQIRAVTRADDEDVHAYQYSGRDADLAPRRSVTTVGDLTLAMIGTAQVRTEYEGATIEGLVTDIGLDVAHRKQLSWNGDSHGERFDVVVTLRLGRIELQGLGRDHPCELIA